MSAEWESALSECIGDDTRAMARKCNAPKGQLPLAQGRVLERSGRTAPWVIVPVYHERPVRTTTYSFLYAAVLSGRWMSVCVVTQGVALG